MYVYVVMNIHIFVVVVLFLCVCHCLATKVFFRLIAGYWMGGGDHEVPRK